MDSITQLYFKLHSNDLLRELLNIISILVPFKTVAYFERAYRLTKHLATSQGHLTLEFKLLYTLYGYLMLKLTITNFNTTTPLQKILWFDFFRLIGLPEHFNLSFALIYAQFIYFYHVCYFKSYQNESMKMGYQVLVLKQVKTVFLEDKYRGKYAIVPLVKRVYMVALNYQQVNVLSVSLFLLNSQLYIFDYLSTNHLHLLPYQLFLFEGNALLTGISYYSCIHVANLSVAMAATMVLVHFILFSQIRSILYRKGIEGNLVLYRVFIHHQIRALLNVLKFDKAIGSLLFCYIITNTPLNALACTVLLQGRGLQENMRAVLIQFIIGQFIPFFVVHLLAAMYSTRLHRPTIRLMALSRQTRYTSLRDQLDLYLYIERMHTSRPYGVTYGGMGLVTMYSFVRFCYLYSQFLIFVYLLELSSGR